MIPEGFYIQDKNNKSTPPTTLYVALTRILWVDIKYYHHFTDEKVNWNTMEQTELPLDI